MSHYVSSFKKILKKINYAMLTDNDKAVCIFNSILHSVFEISSQEGSSKIKFVQIGANDGVTNDPLYPYIQSTKPIGVLVEPLPDIMSKLQKNYEETENLFFENAAIAECNGSMTIYRIPEKLKPEWCKYYKYRSNPSGISSFYYGHLASFIKQNAPKLLQYYNLNDCIEFTKVKTLTLSSLFDKYGIKNLDVLQIDVEGYEPIIINQLLKTNIRPFVINFENKNISQKDSVYLVQSLKSEFYSVLHHKGDVCAFRNVSILNNVSP